MIGKLRFILRITGTFIACVILWAYAITVRAFARNNPKTRYHLLCKGMRAYGYVVGWIIGMTIRVHGTPPKAPFFLVSNHISYTDILLLCATSPAWFVSNAEVAKWPGIGALTRSTNTLFIDRETRRDVHRVNRLIANLVRQDSGVVFYPEGTTSDGTAVLPFKPSLLQPAIELGMPIHCAAIAYTAPPCSDSAVAQRSSGRVNAAAQIGNTASRGLRGCKPAAQ
jgi:1-acyl-sn-glycerol-3-phosphate acyltransferase